MAKKSSSRVFFPWERRHGLLRFVFRPRTRQAIWGALVLACAVWIWRREQHAALVRSTRARLADTDQAVRAYRADHAGTCPKNVTVLQTEGYLAAAPKDAWGRPLRLRCESKRYGSFALASDGPDGIPGGLDQIR